VKVWYSDSDSDLIVKPTKKPPKPAPKKRKRKITETTMAPKKKKKPAVEKRLMRKRTLTSSVSQRISRALSQRLFMVDWVEEGPHKRRYNVLGSTGNLYKIEIGHLVTCSCPDFAKGNLCKHCLFVMMKVLKVNRRDEKLYQRALLTSELEEIFAAAPELRMLTDVRADNLTRKAVKKATGEDVEDDVEDDTKVEQKPLEGNDCPICLEDFTAADKNKVVWCKAQCGNNIHKQCFNMYAKGKGSNLICCFCRAPWEQAGGKAKKAGSQDGFLNFSATSGQSQRRDTSSYSSWHGYHQGYGRRYGYRSWRY